MVKPSTTIWAVPDDYYDFNNLQNTETKRNATVSAETLWSLADCAYSTLHDEFYIRASASKKELVETSVELKTGLYPTNSDGKLCSMGILTNGGYLRLNAQAVRILLNEDLYSKIKFIIKKYSDIKYRISIYATKTDGTGEYNSLNLPEGSMSFTAWTKENFSGKEIKYSKLGLGSTDSSGFCSWNSDGTISFSVSGSGNYYLSIYEDPYAEPQVNHTLEVINDGYGFVDLKASNCYTVAANSGYYLQAVFINGVSKGTLSEINVSEGDDIVVVFAKNGESVDTTQYDAAMSAAAKLEKTKAGIKATTIKLSTVSKVKKGVKITWKKSAGYKVDYYEIYRSTKGASGYKKIATTKSGSKTSYINTKTKKGTRYYYKVRGVRKIEGEKIYTKWSNRSYRKAV